MSERKTEAANADILAKVKKLMALGTSPSEAEAASALEKARTLLARYGLSIEDVEENESEIVENTLLEKKRLRSWESHLIYVITSATFTQALHVQRGDVGSVLIIGREVNAVAAAELFAYLHLVVLKLGRAHSGEVAHLESFKTGVVQRIGERLLDDKEDAWTPEGSGAYEDGGGMGAQTDGRNADSTGSNEACAVASDRALTVQMNKTADRENSDYIAEKYGKTKTKRTGRSVEADSYYRGRAAGDKVSLKRQLG
jgi:hypothetical protein